MTRRNVLFVTFDQLRADALLGDLSEAVPTPNFDRFLSESCVFGRHYSVTTPCGPARASLLTSRSPSSHGVWRNHSPLASGIVNLATQARTLGYEPLLFGYTDSQPDPASRHPHDPDLRVYENTMPGFREIVDMRLDYGFEWPAYLKAQGYPIDVPLTPQNRKKIYRPIDGLGSPALYAANDSDTAYLTRRTIESLDIRRSTGWFAHVTYIRPHPPFVAPAPYHTLIDPQDVPKPRSLRISTPDDHPFIEAWHSQPSQKDLFEGFDGRCRSLSDHQTQLLRATYLGLIAEIDTHLGHLLHWLEQSGEADQTLVILTSDHGESLGDGGLWGKDNVFESAFWIPLAVRAPQTSARKIHAITQILDVAPTIIDWLGGDSPSTWQGRSLVPWLKGDTPSWRNVAQLEICLHDPTQPTRFETALHAPKLQATIVVHPLGGDVRFTSRRSDIPDLSWKAISPTEQSA